MIEAGKVTLLSNNIRATGNKKSFKTSDIKPCTGEIKGFEN